MDLVIDDVNSTDTDPYQPAIVGIREGIGMAWDWNHFRKTGLPEEEYYEMSQYSINPIGLDSDEGIELFDNWGR